MTEAYRLILVTGNFSKLKSSEDLSHKEAVLSSAQINYWCKCSKSYVILLLYQLFLKMDYLNNDISSLTI